MHVHMLGRDGTLWTSAPSFVADGLHPEAIETRAAPIAHGDAHAQRFVEARA